MFVPLTIPSAPRRRSVRHRSRAISQHMPTTALPAPPILHVRRVIVVLAACVLAWIESPACAQDIEPRAYSNAPIGVNFLIAGYAYTRGGVAFGPRHMAWRCSPSAC